MTHAELVERAGRWLRNKCKLSVVIVEAGTWSADEIPDAIGWSYWGESTLIECKVSRADFHSDKRKRVRWGRGMGSRRFYMTPPGVLTPEELPDGWGLLEVHGRSVRMIKHADELDRRRRATRDPRLLELRLLVAELRRQFAVEPGRRRNGLVTESNERASAP